MKFLRYVGLVALSLILPSSFALNEAPQTFTLDGRIFNSPASTTPLLDNVTINVKILSPDETCVLYEESQPFNTNGTSGYFNIAVGSAINAAKRDGDDPNHPMEFVYQNRANIPALNATCVGGVYSPSAGDSRLVRITVIPTVGAPQVFNPPMRLDAVPTAIVAETVQGLSRDNMLEINKNVEMTQGNFEYVFSGTNYPKLKDLLAGIMPVTGGGTISANTQRITNVATPTAASDAATKDYADSNIAGQDADTTVLSAIGAGDVGKVMVWDGSKWTAAAAALDATKLPLDGSGTMTGNLNMGNQNIINSGHILQIPQARFQVGRFTDAQEGGMGLVAGDVGSIWYNTDDTQLKLWTGAVVQEVLTNATVAGGDLSGTYPSPTIAANAVTSAKILDGTITGADIAASTVADSNIIGVAVNKITSAGTQYFTYAPNGVPCGVNEILKWTAANRWECATDVDTGITQLTGDVAAGPGNGSQVATIQANAVTNAKIADNAVTTTKIFANPGVNHIVMTDGVGGANLVAKSCAANEILSWSPVPGLGWQCVLTTSLVDNTVIRDGGNTRGANITVGTNDNFNMYFETNNVTRMVVDTSGNVGIGGGAGTSLDVSAKTDAIGLPRGTTAERPAAPSNGYIRYNTDLKSVEGYVNGGWQVVASGTSPAGTEDGKSLKWNDTTKQFEWFTAGIAGASITSINGSVVPGQTIVAGSAGTDFAINTVAGTGVTTIDLPSSSAANRGLLTAADWTTFNNKLAAISNVATLADGKIWIGDGGAKAQEQTLSGDITMSNTGVTAIGANKVLVGMLANDAVETVKIKDGNVTLAKLAADSVDSSKIVDGSVANADIADVSYNKFVNVAGNYMNYMPNNVECGDGELLKWVAASDQWVCTSISGALGTGYIVDGGNTRGAAITVGTNDDFAFNFEQNNVNVMTIDADGEVGIGTTTPGNLFQVDVNAATKVGMEVASAGVPVVTLGNASNTGYLQIRSTAPTNNVYLGGAANTPNYIILPGTAKFGLGTASPSFRTEISGTQSNGYFGITNSAAGDIFTINSSGNVGIGTNAPAGIFDVRGGTAAASTNGTNISMTAQNAGAGGNNNGGNLVLTPGTGTGTGSAGYVQADGLYMYGKELNIFASNTGPLVINSRRMTDLSSGTVSDTAINPTSGSVGIGTTTPTSKLQVAVNTGAAITNALTLSGTGNAGADRGVALLFQGPAGAGTVADAGKISVGQSAGTSAYMTFATGTTGTLNEQMRITSGGDVGIGTAAPNEKLTVEGILSLKESAAPSLTANYGKLYVKTDNKLYYMDDSGAEKNLSDTVSAAITTLTGDVTASGSGSVAATIAANAVTTGKILDGTILVGDLADNAVETAKIKDANVTLAKLAANSVDASKIVDGSITTADLANGADYILNGGNTKGATVTVGTNDAQSFVLETNNAPAMTILNGGNIGIGTAAPNTMLDVNGGYGPYAGRIAAFGGTVAIGKSGSEYGLLNIMSTSGRSLALTMNNSTDATISSSFGNINVTPAANTIFTSGNVGIGTTAPAKRLEVTGDDTGAFRATSSVGGYVDIFSVNSDPEARGRVHGGGGGLKLVSDARNYYESAGGAWGSNHIFKTTNPMTFANNGSTTTFITGSGTWAPTAGSGEFVGLNLVPTINQTGAATGNYTGLRLNALETAATGSSNRLLDLQKNSVSQFVVMSSGNVGIGTTSANEKLTVEGVMSLREVAAPSLTANYGKLYVKTDNKLYYMDDSGAEKNLSDTAGAAITALTGDVTASGSGSVAATIAANAVTTGKILDGTILVGDLADNAVETAKIKDANVTLAKLAADSVDSSKIVDDTIVAADIATNGVGTAEILDGTILVGDLADNAVETAKIKDANVTLAKLAANSVDSSKIVDGSVANADIADVSYNKFVNVAGNYMNYMPDNVECGDGEILTWVAASDRWVCGTNSAASAITSLTGDVTGTGPGATATTIAANAVTSGKILDGTILVGDLADNAVETAKIKDANVTLAKLAANSVDASKIVDGSITTADLANGDDYILNGGNTKGAAITVGTNDAQSFVLETNNAPAMTILNGGNVGVGTNAPGGKLTVSSNAATLPAPAAGTLVQLAATDGTNTLMSMDSFNSASALNLRRAQNTAASPSAVGGSQNLGSINWHGYGTTDYFPSASAKIDARTAEVWTDSTAAAYLAFYTRPSATAGSAPERMRIDQNGNVGIGTTSVNEKLTVEGVMSLREVAAPSLTANYGKIYVKTDNKLYYMDDSGAEKNLSDTAGAAITALTGDVTASGSGSVAATIAANAVTTGKILDGTILVGDLADNAVETAKIKDANVTLAKLASDSVDSAKIIDGTIVVADIADNAIETAKIKDANVTLAKLASDSVNSSKIVDGTIVVGDLANDAVETAKIKDANVTLAKLAANSVDTSKIVDGSITTADLANGGDYILDGGNTKGAAVTIGTNDDFAVNFEQNNATVMTIDDTGKVGIGTPTPTAPLHVVSTLTEPVTDVEGVLSSVTFNPSADADTNQQVAGVTGSAIIPVTAVENANQVYGLNAWAENKQNGASTYSIFSIYGRSENNGTNALTLQGGAYYETAVSAGSVANYYGMTAKTEQTGGAVTNEYGLRFRSDWAGAGAGTKTNRYMLYLTATGAGVATNDYGVYQQTATQKNFFAGNVGIGTTAPGGLLDVSKAVSAAPSAVGKYLSISTSTLTDNTTAISGTAATNVFNSIAAPTLAATNATVTTTNAYNVYVGGAPIKGANNTATNSIALGVASANVGAQTNSYGLYVNAQTGASANYAATFMGGNVGIGTATPAKKFVVQDDVGVETRFINNNAGANQAADSEIAKLDFNPRFNGGIASEVARISSYYQGDGTTRSGDLRFLTGNSSAATERMRIMPSGNIGIGTTAPNEKLTVEGVMSLREVAAPSLTANYGKIYVKTDNKLYYMDDGGAEKNLSDAGASGITSLTGDVTGTGPGATSTTIAANAITTGKILDGTILVGDLADNAVETAKIKDANVTLAKLAADSVDSSKIVDGTIVVADIANNAVETAKIKDGAVTNVKITDVSYNKFVNVAGNYMNYMPNGTECGDGELLKWVAASDQWVCSSIAGALGTGYIVDGGNTRGSAITIGTNDDFAFNLEQNNAPVMTIDADSEVGIGVTDPNWKFQVNVESATGNGITINQAGNTPAMRLFRNNGTFALPTKILNNDILGQISGGGFWDGKTNPYFENGDGRANIRFYATQDWTSSTTNGSAITFMTTSNGAGISSERVRIDQDGDVGIGTTTPAASLHVSKTAVTGTVASTGTAVTGTGTNFTSSFAVGDSIVANGQVKVVTAIGNDTTLTVNSAFSSDLVAGTAIARVGAIFQAGYVGIGTASPLATLDVSGSSRVSGTALFGLTSGQNLSIQPNLDVTALNPGTTTVAAQVQGPINGHMVFDLRNNDAQDAIALRYSAANTAIVDTIGFVMKGDGKVGIGTTAPNEKLTVEGVMSLREVAAPSLTANYGKLYVKTDNKLYYMDDGGAEKNLSDAGASAVTSLTGDVTASGPGAAATTIAANAVTTGKILDGTILTGDIAADTILAGNIATGAVATAEILDGTILVGDLADNAVETAKIKDGAVTNVKITDVSYNKFTNVAGNYMNYKPNNVECNDGESLVWVAATDRWVCGSAGGASSIDGLSDGNTTSGANVLFLGAGAGAVNTAGPNTAVGINALNSSITMQGNTALGFYALNTATATDYAVAVGHGALRYGESADGVAVGASALAYGGGSANVGIGFEAGKSVSGTGANTSNVFVGRRAGYAVNGANGNVYLGHRAAEAATSGDTNVMIGYMVGPTLTTGSNNILIGNGVDVAAAGTSNRLNIGDTIMGDVSTKKVGIGAITPNETLTVEGVTSMKEVAAPSLTAGYGKIYVKTDNNLYYMDEAGVESNILAPTVGNATSGSNTASFTINSNSNGAGSDGGFSFNANGSPLMTISNAGVVDITATTASTSTSTGALTVDGGLGVAGAIYSGQHVITSTSATAFAVGPNGVTNPVFNVDASTASAATGISVKGAAATAGVTITATSSNANENVSLISKGTGSVILNSTGVSANGILLQNSGNTRLAVTDVNVAFTPATSVTAATTRFAYTGAADVTLTAATEAPGVHFNLGQTRQHTAGAAIATQRDFRVSPSTHSMTAASAITDAMTFSVDSPVLSGLNNTITNSHGIYVGTADVTPVGGGAVTNAYGLSVMAPTGATNNYSAYFSGKVGIGTTNPFTMLEVNGAAQSLTAGDGLVNVFSSDAQGVNKGGTLNFGGHDGSGTLKTFATMGGLKENATSSNYAGYFAITTRPAGGSLTERMRISSDGYVGINNTSPSVALDVTGDIEYTGTISDVSDARLKEDIQDLSGSALARLGEVRPVSFRMKDDPKHRVEFGVIAQEVEGAFPELVNTHDDEMKTKSVNYMGFIAWLIEAVQELKAKVDGLIMSNEAKYLELAQKLEEQNRIKDEQIRALEMRLQKLENNGKAQRKPAGDKK